MTDHPQGYPSQRELEQPGGYTPGGIDVSIYDSGREVPPKRTAGD